MIKIHWFKTLKENSGLILANTLSKIMNDHKIKCEELKSIQIIFINKNGDLRVIEEMYQSHSREG